MFKFCAYHSISLTVSQPSKKDTITSWVEVKVSRISHQGKFLNYIYSPIMQGIFSGQGTGLEVALPSNM
jgi:hypothetical protein